MLYYYYRDDGKVKDKVMKIEEVISKKQIEEIKNIILEQSKYHFEINFEVISGKVINKNFEPHNQVRDLKTYIHSGFKEFKNNMYITELKYGNGNTMPVLYNNKCKIYISCETPAKNATYLRKIYKNNKDGETIILVKYKSDKKNKVIKKIWLHIPISNNTDIDLKNIYEHKTY